MSTSRTYKIFAMQNQQPVQGRNANIAGSMMKKAQLSMTTSERPELNPFMGSSYGTNENSLANSQVSELSQGQSQEALRKMVREEVERRVKEDRQRNDMNIMKAEMRGLKESFQEVSREYNQRLNESYVQAKEETQGYVQKVIHNHEIQTKNSLKKIVSIMREDIRKDLIGYAGREFVPLSFLEELEKQLNQIEDRIQFIQNKTQGSELRSSKDPVILAETVDLRMNKIDRQLESLRKTIGDLPARVKGHDQDIADIIKMTEQEKETTRFSVQRLRSHLNDQENQIKKISALEMVSQNLKLDVDFFKSKLQDLEKSKNQQTSRISDLQRTVSENSTATSEFREFKKKSELSSSSSVHGMHHANIVERPLSPRVDGKADRQTDYSLQNQQLNVKVSSPGQPIKITYSSPQEIKPTAPPSIQVNHLVPSMNSPGDSPQTAKIQSTEDREEVRRSPSPRKEGMRSPSPQKEKVASSPVYYPEQTGKSEQREKPKVTYKIDADGYLMDCEGKYLLDDDNSMILVPEEKIKQLAESGLINS